MNDYISNSTDETCHYFTAAHWRAQDAALEVLAGDQGAAALIGPTGSGKSVLTRQIMSELPAEITTITASAAAMTRSDLILLLHRQLGAGDGAREAKNKADALGRRIRQLSGLGQRVALVLEEADQAAPELLDLVFRLRKVGRDADGAPIGVRTLFVGGPGLISALEASATAADGLALRAHIRFFTREETDQYLAQRLAPLEPFGEELIAPDAAERLFELTLGSPRLLGLVTGHAMLFASENEIAPVTAEMIDEAAEATALFLKRTAAEAESNAMAGLPDVLELKELAPKAAAAPAEEAEPEIEDLALPPLKVAPLDDDGFEVRSRLEGVARKGAFGSRSRKGIRTVRKTDMSKPRRLAVIAVAAGGALAAIGYVAPLALKTWEQRPDVEISVDEMSETLREAGEVAGEKVGEAYVTASEALADAKVTAEATYEANRGEILGVVDGVLDGAEDVARSVAEGEDAPGVVKQTASVMVENIYETRSTLEVGQVIEEAEAAGPVAGEKVVSGRVATTLALADQRFAAEQYTRPAGESAYDGYLRVLRFDGRNAEAHAGLKRIEGVYEGLAEEALTRGEFEKFHSLNETLDRIRRRRPI